MMMKTGVRSVVTLAAVLGLAHWMGAPATGADGSEPGRERNPHLQLEIFDGATLRPIAARFGVDVNGVRWFPDALNEHGLRFISVHQSKQQLFVSTYARGTGPVVLSLPKDAQQLQVHVVRGFEYMPATVTHVVADGATALRITMNRWTNLAARGWYAADAHLHYDRFNRGDNKDWFTMLAGDDLQSGHFMMAKGGQTSGRWAQQYGYGKRGEVTEGGRLLTAGMEYRDTAQGHINLLGMPEIVEPIMAGAGGTPNHPLLKSVLLRTRDEGGLPGAAHGGSLSREPTVIADAVLGALDFLEIGNSHLYSVEKWYGLMNCGYHLPPTAGTDLPNYPDRDNWQPFLGGMRMYVKLERGHDFEAWKAAVRSGRVFVSSGPILSFHVNGTETGGTLEVKAGEEITIEAEAASPVGVRELELVRNGDVLPSTTSRTGVDGVHRVRARYTMRAAESSWFAARATGVPIQALHRAAIPPAPWHKRDVVAHSAAVRVIVDGRPIRSPKGAAALADLLRGQRSFYETTAVYESDAQRQEMLRMMDAAIAKLAEQGGG